MISLRRHSALVCVFVCGVTSATCLQSQPGGSGRKAGCPDRPTVGERNRQATGSPLHKAIRDSDVAAVEQLFKQTANPNERDSFGNTPLVVALSPMALLEPLEPGKQQKRRAEIEREHEARKRIIAMLLQAGADVNTAGVRGITPLMAAALWASTSTEDLRIVKELLDRGVAINAQSDDGDTALIIAARRGNKAVVDLLLSRGAAKDLKNCEGHTASIVAAAGKHTSIVKVLE